MFCISCGKEMAQNSAFCEFCGEPQQPQNAPPKTEPKYNYAYNGMGGYSPYPQDENDKPMTVGGWLKTMLIMCIPLVNIIMVFVWAFGDGNKSRKNYFRAYLLFALIIVVLTFVLVFSIGLGANMVSSTMSPVGV